MYDTLSAAANAAACRDMSPSRRRSTTTAGDRALLWHPYTQMLTAPAPIPIARAKGVRLYGSDGRVLIDAIGSWWVNIHGHCHPRLARAVRRQISALDHVLFAGFTHAPAVELARKLISLAPRGLERVFYSDDGSTAVEAGLKMAMQYWRNKGRPRKRTLAAFEKAYHGDTAGAMSLSARSVFTRAFEPLLFPVRRVPAEPGRLDAFLRRNSASLAAVIVEPLIQAAGGMRFSSPAFLARLAALCRRHEVLLIADEVMTGFGRTGRMFACEHVGVSPDILCLSKALTGGVLPLAATLTSEKVYSAFLGKDPLKTFYHCHSYTANPVACAAALENLRIFEEEPVLERVLRIEARFKERLLPLKRLPQVADARVLGAVGVVELTWTGGYLAGIGRRLSAEFLRRGVLLRPLGNVLYLTPPYSISRKDLDFVLDKIEDVVSSLA